MYLTAEHHDISMYRDFDFPFKYTMELIGIALYLDLSGLVDMCLAKLASYFSSSTRLISRSDFIE
jgi:hypothetical protein